MENINFWLCLVLFLVFASCNHSEQERATSKLDRSKEAFNLKDDGEYGPLVRVALVQLEMLVPQDPKRHIADAFTAIDEAGKSGVDLIVLPVRA